MKIFRNTLVPMLSLGGIAKFWRVWLRLARSCKLESQGTLPRNTYNFSWVGLNDNLPRLTPSCSVLVFWSYQSNYRRSCLFSSKMHSILVHYFVPPSCLIKRCFLRKTLLNHFIRRNHHGKKWKHAVSKKNKKIWRSQLSDLAPDKVESGFRIPIFKFNNSPYNRQITLTITKIGFLRLPNIVVHLASSNTLNTTVDKTNFLLFERWISLNETNTVISSHSWKKYRNRVFYFLHLIALPCYTVTVQPVRLKKVYTYRFQ